MLQNVALAAVALGLVVGGAAIAIALPPASAALAVAFIGFVALVSFVRPFPNAGPAASIICVLIFGAAHVGIGQSAMSLGPAAVGAAWLALGAGLTLLLARRFHKFREELAGQAMAIRALSERDEVTGAIKEEHLAWRLAEEIGRAQRYGYPITVLVLAVDELDAGALGAGEAVDTRVEMARAIHSAVRRADSVAHHGAAGFSIILPHTPLRGALEAASKVASSISEAAGISVRCGVVEFPEDAATVEDLLSEAERALEFARRAGLSVASRTLFT